MLDGSGDPRQHAGRHPGRIDGIRSPTADYAAIYFPWIQVFDPCSGGTEPTCSLAAERLHGRHLRPRRRDRGVHKAPANEVVRGALGLEYRSARTSRTGSIPTAST